MTDVRISIGYTANGPGARKLPAAMTWNREFVVGDNPLLFTEELERVFNEGLGQVLEAITKLDPRAEPKPSGPIQAALETVGRINKANRAQRISAQAMHLMEPENRSKVLDHIGGDQLDDITQYLSDYGDQWDLYQRLCEDCDIKPRPELFHPNPED